MRILIVEDDIRIVRSLERILEAYGHDLTSTGDGREGVSYATAGDVDLVLLDISLPGIDGHEVLKRVRDRDPRLPILMLTARDDLPDKVSALRSGADDYLTKPFSFEELLARIESLRRRSEQGGLAVLEVGPLRMDLLSRQAWRSGKEIELSAREFSLLEYFMRNPGRELPRQQMLSDIWGYSFDPGSNVLDVYVRHLRQKIDHRDEASLIVAVRGVGYRLEIPSIDS